MSPDLYDNAITYFMENTSLISYSWDFPCKTAAGLLLFQAASPSGQPEWDSTNKYVCGDLCEIVSKESVAFTSEMTELICEDIRIPHLENQSGHPPLQTKHLTVFAEWQRLFDLCWNRKPVELLHQFGFEPKSIKVKG